MSWDQILTGFVYLAIVLVLVGHRQVGVRRCCIAASFCRQNSSRTTTLAIGSHHRRVLPRPGDRARCRGVRTRVRHVLTEDGIDLVVFGLMAIVLLNLSGWINDKIIFSKFRQPEGDHSGPQHRAWALLKAAIMSRSA